MQLYVKRRQVGMATRRIFLASQKRSGFYRVFLVRERSLLILSNYRRADVAWRGVDRKLFRRYPPMFRLLKL